METVDPIFILGTQRSGTTLISRILSSHKNLYIQNELPMQGLFEYPFDKATLVARFTRKIFEIHGVELSDEPGKSPIWGLKEPLLTYQLPALMECFPNSKYILIVRDGRGVVNSYMDNRWGLGTNVYTGAERWKKEVNLQVDFMQKINHGLTIKYEDLVTDMQSTIRNICEFLEVEFDEQMVNYYQKGASYAKNRENINTYKAPDASITQKWREVLSTRQIGVIEQIAEKELKSFDYEFVGSKPYVSILEKLYYKLHQAIVGEFQLQYQLKFKDLFKRLG